MTSANFFGAALGEIWFEPLCAPAEHRQSNNSATTLAQSSVRLINFFIHSIRLLSKG
jgi:hypothetical protein